ncbi:MAG: hypothetical protein WDM96_19745 [Lacunisphaera sp.]
MTYAEWQNQQNQRAEFAAAGVAYKSPSELRHEAEEMRRLAQDTTFTPAR